MISSLLECWLAHYDPIHRGWTPSGIANGVCATSGYFFPRIRGGYNLRRCAGEALDAAAAIIGAAGADATTIRTFPWVAHEASTSYVYGLTAMSGGGVENVIDEVLSHTAFDAAGEWVGARPNAPSDLRVTPTAGGRFVLQWNYTRDGEQAEPAQFNVYHDNGTGAVDFEHLAAMVDYRRGQFCYTYSSEAFAHAACIRWVVRAASAAGVEEANEMAVGGWAEAQAPPVNPAVLLTCVQV